MTESFTQRLATFASTLQYEDLPAAVVDAAKRLTLDCLGTALAGKALGDGCPEVLRVMKALGGPAESSIVGDDTKIAAPNAAFANGAFVHALNFDASGHAAGHTGLACFSAPLALAQARGPVSGRRFLTALVAAAEVLARITAPAVEPKRLVIESLLIGQYFGYVAAAAGAGHVLGLDPKRMLSAFGLALMQVSGTRQVIVDGDAPAKAIYGAFPAQAGVVAALLAEAGLEAEINAVEGRAGLYAMSTAGAFAAPLHADDLGTTFEFLATQFKLWPVSGNVAPYIEAAIKIQSEHDLALDDIVRVEVVGSPGLRQWFEPVEERRHPANAASAANSVQFATAKALAHRRVTLADFNVEGLRDDVAAKLAARIEHRLDEGAGSSAVIVTTVAGRRLTGAVEKALGGPSRPISTAQLAEKFRDCCSHAPHLKKADVESLIGFVGALETAGDISPLAAAGPARP